VALRRGFEHRADGAAAREIIEDRTNLGRCDRKAIAAIPGFRHAGRYKRGRLRMIERDIDITSRNGPIPSFAVCPDGPGSYPGIVLYMDAPGIREELRNLARRIAKQGYVCLLPDLYYRLGTLRFNMGRRTEGFMQTMFAAMNSLTNALVVEDTAALIGWLDAQEKVSNGPLGCIGYCMSGKFITTVAARYANRYAASASLYGVGIVTKEEDSPHKLVPKIKGEIYFGFAEHDQHVPPEVIPTLTDALKGAGTRYTLEILPGSHHGYQFPERDVYNTDAAEHSWEKIFAMWKENLK
jgi:carboxymethylenebutenolidase